MRDRTNFSWPLGFAALLPLGCAALLGLAGCGDDGLGSGSATDSGSGATSDASTGSGSAGETSTSDSATGSGSESGTETGGADMCTSQMYWTQGDQESPLMHPGGACLDCHDDQVGEDIIGRLAIAGTVYPTLHEPDDCNGVTNADGPVTVEITTADDVVISLSVNAAGNFFYDLEETPTPIAFPIKAKVKRGGMEMVMGAAQMSGDCNSCHTEAGANNAPGRILAP